MPAPNYTSKLKLRNPVEGSFGWHQDWYDMTEIVDKHPGILTCTDTTYPEDPWAGQVVYVSNIDLFKYYDGTAWETFPPTA